MERNSLNNSVTEKQKAEVKNWWRAFNAKESEIIKSFSEDYKGTFNLSEWMHENLNKVDPNIMWEYGPGINKSHRLVLTPESKTKLRPLVRYIIGQASESTYWEFYEYRLSAEMVEAEAIIQARTEWENISEISFELILGKFNLIDIRFYVPYNESENDLLKKAFVLAEVLLGEECLEKWVGVINVQKKLKLQLFGKLSGSKDPKNSLATLKKDFEAKIHEIKKSFTPYCKPTSDEKSKGVLFKLKPAEQKDYSSKDDLFVASFISENLFRAIFQGQASFYSERFSIKDTFIYIKMDGTADDLNQEIFEDKASIEDALCEALNKNNLGYIIGGGTGKRYSYIDLVISDLLAAVKTIQDVLRHGKLTKKSWILFSDADLQSEWIGVWDDSPNPYIQIDQ